MRRRQVWLVLVVVAIAAVISIVVVRRRAARAPEQMASETAVVTRADVRKTVMADGTLRALTTVSVKSDAGGRVLLLAVDVGDVVHKGDLIARIDPTDTQMAYTQALASMQGTRAQLAQAEAQAQAQPSMTRAAIGEAQASYEATLTDLRRLQTATQPRDRADAKSNLEKAQAALKSARENLSRMDVATHPVSRVEAKSNLEQANAAVRQAEESLKRLKQSGQPQSLAESRAALSKARSDLTSAERDVSRYQVLYDKGGVALTTLEEAENRRDTAQASFDTANERMRTLADDQAAELATAEAAVQQARAAHVAAQRKWDAVDGEQGAERRAAEAAVEEAQAGYDAALRRWKTIDQDHSAELAAARARVTQARNSLANVRANAVQTRVRASEVDNQRAQVTKADALVEQTKTSLSYTTITAPRDGIILAKNVEEGTIVNSGRSGVAEGVSIVELGDLSTMYVDVQIDETDLADIKVGQEVEIGVESLQGKTVTGHVTRVDPQATTISSITTVKVEIEIRDHDERLMPGLSAECTFVVGERKDVLTLPPRAVRERGGEHSVTVPGDSGPRVVPIEVGLVSDDAAEVLFGLNEGDTVILPDLGGGAGNGAGGPGGPPGPPGGGADFLKK